jgi:pyruvate,water dikinase
MAGYYNWPLWEFDEERDLKVYKCWFLMSHACVPALKPFDLWIWVACASRRLAQAADRLDTPEVLPNDFRTKDGYLYASPKLLPEEEAKRREPLFREKMAPWIENPEKLYQEDVSEMMAVFGRLQEVDVQKIPDRELLDHLLDCKAMLLEKYGQMHMLQLHAIYTLHILFEDMCKELLGIGAEDPLFKALTSGFETHEWQTNRGIWQLANRAKELGLEQLFQVTPDDEELLSKLGESDGGREWLKELHEFIEGHGARTPRLLAASAPSWMEKPSMAIPDIRRVMDKGGAFPIDEERQRLSREREEAERVVLSRVPLEKREMFEKLMRGAQFCAFFDEDHIYYMEGVTDTILRRATIEIGMRFARAEMIDDPEDIYYLIPDEIEMALVGMHRCPMHKTVRIRKEQHEEFLKTVPPPFIGDPTTMPGIIAKNAFLRVVAPMPIVKPELKADLYGSGSAPGVAEGIARVVMDVMDRAQMKQVQAGDILVAPLTHVYWTPLFGIVKAVVTDAGGALAHPVICGREFGIPVVAGTIDGTRKIKTGDKIRVDGDNCCVYILSEKE